MEKVWEARINELVMEADYEPKSYIRIGQTILGVLEDEHVCKPLWGVPKYCFFLLFFVFFGFGVFGFFGFDFFGFFRISSFIIGLALPGSCSAEGTCR